MNSKIKNDDYVFWLMYNTSSYQNIFNTYFKSDQFCNNSGQYGRMDEVQSHRC